MPARRSVRCFAVQDVSVEDAHKLIAAGFAAPSADNGRPWHFVLVRGPVTRLKLKGMHRWTWILDKAPPVIAVLGNGGDDPWWIEDCAAAENILLEATALGVPACGRRVLALIGVGYPGENKSPRTRRRANKVSCERFDKRSG